MPSQRIAPRVLVVDDNVDAADSLASLLQYYDYDVRAAYDGEAALSVARTFTPDCVISDLTMPRMDGYALARAIRADPVLADAKLIAYSALAGERYSRDVTEAGFDYCLVKPVHPNQVLEVLKMVEELKALATKTKELASQNVALAGQTKELLQEVKQEVKEVKQEVRELKKEVQELKQDASDKPPPDSM